MMGRPRGRGRPGAARRAARRVDGSPEEGTAPRGSRRRGRSSAPATSRTRGPPTTSRRSSGRSLDHLQFAQGKDEHTATALDRYFAVAYAVRDRLMRHWIQTQQAYYRNDAKRVYYLSLEFLMGRALENNLLNLGLLRPDAGAR